MEFAIYSEKMSLVKFRIEYIEVKLEWNLSKNSFFVPFFFNGKGGGEIEKKKMEEIKGKPIIQSLFY